jgi:serine/threonine-protein kinase
MGGDHGEVVLLDWGNARRIDQSNRACRETGTPEYMPPEQADGIADVRSDVFGVGAILYELLAGTSPHGWAEGIRPRDWIEQVKEAHFERPSRVQRRIPRDLESICLHALEKAPDLRYQTVAELAADLRRYLCGESVTGGRNGFARLVRRFR